MPDEDFPDAGILLGKKDKSSWWRKRLDSGGWTGCLPVVVILLFPGLILIAR